MLLYICQYSVKPSLLLSLQGLQIASIFSVDINLVVHVITGHHRPIPRLDDIINLLLMVPCFLDRLELGIVSFVLHLNNVKSIRTSESKLILLNSRDYLVYNVYSELFQAYRVDKLLLVKIDDRYTMFTSDDQ